jgi:hypothetical protein
MTKMDLVTLAMEAFDAAQGGDEKLKEQYNLISRKAWDHAETRTVPVWSEYELSLIKNLFN